MASGLRRATRVALSSMVVVAFAAGCGSAGPSPSPTAGATVFELDVQPTTSVGFTIPGSTFMFLVSVSGAPADGPVTISAEADGASVAVEPASLPPGTVGEVTVVPEPVTGDEVPLEVTIHATRGGIAREATRTITVQPGTDELGPEAADHLAPFITWLAANRPELGITAETTWEGTAAPWVLIVSHYQYVSNDWELDLAWHVMIPPDDWCRIALRRRWVEATPSLAFEISSFSRQSVPHEIAPPDAVWR